MIYVIARIRTKAGISHEREARRKGHRVSIAEINVGNPLILTYIDDCYKMLCTTPVEAFTDIGGSIVVQTRNSVYVFRAEVADNPEN
jgi:hypothetical protein